MKKIVLTLAIAFGTFGTLSAQVTEPQGNPSFILDENGNLTETTSPIMEFEAETYDFGTIPEGPKVEYSFAFKNTGKEPLEIKDVKGSCGCTTPEWPKEAVAPGQTSYIKAIYNTSGRPGPFNKSITITSNAYTPTKRLFIKGTVEKAETPATQPEKAKSIVNEGNE